MTGRGAVVVLLALSLGGALAWWRLHVQHPGDRALDKPIAGTVPERAQATPQIATPALAGRAARLQAHAVDGRRLASPAHADASAARDPDVELNADDPLDVALAVGDADAVDLGDILDADDPVDAFADDRAAPVAVGEYLDADDPLIWPDPADAERIIDLGDALDADDPHDSMLVNPLEAPVSLGEPLAADRPSPL